MSRGCDGCEYDWSDPCPNEASCWQQSEYVLEGYGKPIDYSLDHGDEPCTGCIHEPKCTCQGKCRYFKLEGSE